MNPIPREGEERYRNLLKNVPGVVFQYLLDREGRDSFIFIEENCIDLFGISSREIQSNAENLFRLVRDDDLFSLRKAIKESAEDLSPYIRDDVILKPSGKERWIHTVSNPRIRENGDIIWDGIFNDVTEDIRIRNELIESRNRYKLAMEIKNEGIWDWRLTDNFVYFDNRYYTIAGYRPCEFPAGFEEWTRHVHPEDIERATDDINRYLTGDTPVYDTEFRFLRKDGSYMWIQSRGIIVERDDDGNPLHFVGTHTDIEQKKKTEEKLKSRIEQLYLLNSIAREISRKRDLRLMVEAAARLINKIMKVKETIITLFNDECSSQIVYAHIDTDENRSGSLIGLKTEVTGDVILEQLLTGAASVNVPHVQTNPLASHHKKSLAEREIRSIMYIALKQHGRVIGIISIGCYKEERVFTNDELNLAETIAYQITGAIENIRLLEKAQNERKNAEKANSAKSMFLAHISHELRTPLNSILGFTQILSRREDNPHEVGEYLNIIEKSGEHLLTLINDVLSMSKIESGYVELKNTDFDLHRLFEGLKEMFSLKVMETGVDMRFRIASSVPRYVKADESKLRQILVNLIGNAVKFTHEGSIELSAESRFLNSRPGMVRLDIEISDTGEGIRKEEQERIFKRFFQAWAGRNSKTGTGLGLSISRQFVKMMGGEIRVESEPGKGSSFRFSVEVQSLNSPEGLSESKEASHKGPDDPDGPSPAGRLKVLIVDDSDINRLLLKQHLRPAGHELREAADGREAFESWREWRPDLILMDMQMPVLDGFEATRLIRSREDGKKRTKIIAVTASAMEEERMTMEQTGCDDIIIKPVVLSSLQTVMSRLFQEDHS